MRSQSSDLSGVPENKPHDSNQMVEMNDLNKRCDEVGWFPIFPSLVTA